MSNLIQFINIGDVSAAVKTPTQPVKTPTQPVKTPTQPVTTLPSPLNTAINKAAITFNAANIFEKDILKLLLIDSVKQLKGSPGLQLTNIGDAICYTLSTFNYICRMRYLLYAEIDNLTDYNDILAIINNKGNLIDDDINKFNKYLLIQTFIEFMNDSIMNKLSYGSHNRIKFIRQRLNNYKFIKKYTHFLDYLNTYFNENNSKILNFINNNKNIINNSAVNAAYNNLQTLEYNFIFTEEVYNTLNGYRVDPYVNILSANTTYYNDLKIIYDKFNTNTIINTNPEYAFFKQYYNVLNDFITSKTVSDNTINTIIKPTLPLTYIDKDTLINKFGLTIDNVCPTGQSAITSSIYIIEELKSTHIISININYIIELNNAISKKPYYLNVIYNSSISLGDLKTNFATYKIKNYRLCALLLNCEGKHSIFATCYDKCKTAIFNIINETDKITKLLNNTKQTAEITPSMLNGDYGHMCNLMSIKIESILYECSKPPYPTL